jgi:hypothetical protein
MFKFIMKNQKIMKELIPIKKSIAASIKVILAFLFLQTNVYAQAPCPNCPQVIGLFDTSKCQNGVTLEASTGYTNVIPQQVNNPSQPHQVNTTGTPLEATNDKILEAIKKQQDPDSIN